MEIRESSEKMVRVMIASRVDLDLLLVRFAHHSHLRRFKDETVNGNECKKEIRSRGSKWSKFHSHRALAPDENRKRHQNGRNAQYK